ncbi:hypothetical protein GGS26DRAFT_67158 [Hypomontagnella submonticulosa]|nr:hypothetical protein GGS26DRAFT_67158 [Hypomontagnella submonticulosa]
MDLLLESKMNDPSDELGGATVDTLRQFIAEVGESYISRSDASGLYILINYIGFSRRVYSPRTRYLFKTNCLPILEGFISYITSLKTPVWHFSPERQPSELSDIFPIQLKILKGKYWDRVSEILSSEFLQEFADHVTTLMKELGMGRRFYDDRWDVLKSIVLKQFDRKHFSLAREFGPPKYIQIVGCLPVDHLCLDLVEAFMSGAIAPEDA